jgi:hypothetical protein
MDRALAAQVRSRAGFRCEYCRVPDSVHPWPFEIEHVVAEQHGGLTTLSNLAYACLQCNRHKGPNLAGIDRRTSRTKLVRLYNPRRHRWAYHFAWDGGRVVGRTPIGRVTVEVLALNDSLRVALREPLITEGVFPPVE